MKNILEYLEYSTELYKDKIAFTDEENELSTEYGVRSIPTILFFKDGKLADKQVGASPKASIKAKIDALL